MTLLRITVDASWPERHADCDWRLLDDAGRVLQRGRSEPRHWPGVAPREPGAPAGEAPRCELVLTADQALCLLAKLPAGAAGRKREVVAYAVEDRLIDEPDDCHFAVGAPRGDGSSPIVVVARARMRNILAALSSLGLSPQRAVVEAETLPLPADGWCLRISGGTGCLRTGDGWLHIDGIEAGPPPLLRWALAQAGAGGCRRLAVIADEPQPALAAEWPAQLGIPVEPMAEAHTQRIPLDAVDLLHGEFAPPREKRAFWRNYRTAALVAMYGLAAYAVFSLGEWAWLARQAAHLKAQQATLFRTSFPQEGTVVAPPLQMQRNVDAERVRRGLAGESDFLALLAVLAEAAPGRVEELRYDANRLTAKLILADAKALDNLRRAVGHRGIRVEVREATTAPAGLRATLIVTKGGMGS